jgi:L-ascorbate metabolism protein UlaG (beta-lactamase superfamily)
VDITWYGHSCFRLNERGSISIVTDPYSAELGLPPLKLKADVVTISHDKPGHNFVDAVKSANPADRNPSILRGPGEYEVGGVFITGLPMNYSDEERVHPNVGYLIQYGSLSVLHLGDLAHVPDQSTIEALGEVNVVLVPVGGGSALRASTAAEVIALIEPNYIVPMHYMLPGLTTLLDPVDKFLKEMGISRAMQEEDILKVTSGSLPEQPQVILLRPQINGGG